MQDIAEQLKVLADPARLRILKELLLVREEKNICVKDLAKRLGISQPNVSHHLKVLKSAGFIACRKPCDEDQRYAYYLVDQKKIEGLFTNVLHAIS